jgi:membrane protein
LDQTPQTASPSRPPRLTPRSAWRLAMQAVSSWQDDYASSMGAALAYYTMFSVAPLLLIVVSVAGLVFGEDAARGEVFGQLEHLMGTQGASAVQSLLQSVNKPGESTLAAFIGTVVLMVGATTVFAELQSSLDRIWRAPALHTGGGLWGLVRSRLLSFGMIMGLGFLLMVSLVLSAALAALEKWWAPWFGGWALLAQVVNLIVSFGLITVIFAMIYKVMPRAHVQWRDVWVGAGVTSLLFAVGKYLIGLYIGRSSVTSGFGAAGSLAVLLVWVYYSAQIFLMGAEFTWVYAHTFGSRRGEPRPGAATAEVPTRGHAPAVPAEGPQTVSALR